MTREKREKRIVIDWKVYQNGCNIKKETKKGSGKYTCPNIIENNECLEDHCPMLKEW